MAKRLTEPLLSGSVLQEQIDLEMNARRDGANDYARKMQSAVERGAAARLKPAERIMLHWWQPFLTSIATTKREYATRVGRKSPEMPVIQSVDSKILAYITIHETLGALIPRPEGVRLTNLARKIGNAVAAELSFEALRKDHRAFLPTKRRLVSNGLSPREALSALEQLKAQPRQLTPTIINRWARAHLGHETGRIKLLIKIGTKLLWCLITTASASDYDDGFTLAFHHERRRKGSKHYAYLTLDQRVHHTIREGHLIRQYMRPKYLPMICPPFAWTAQQEGGYARLRTPLITKPTPDQKQALTIAKLGQVYECLNAVNQTAWQVNPTVYAAVTQVISSGGGTLGIPRQSDWPFPPRPEGFDPEAPPGKRWVNVPKEPKRKWRAEAAKIHAKNIGEASQRKSTDLCIQTADKMRRYSHLWYPHQLDFRGRTYPIPYHLNHQGDDVNRGIMQFAEAKALGTTGMRWLLIHMANCWGHGVDHQPYEHRMQWAESHWSANISDEGLWTQAEKPWQFLAAQYELQQAMRSDAPEEYRSRIPVQIDGTCNGLQHYAGLGRDEVGAKAVNCLPSDQPADVYSQIKDVALEIVERDAAEGEPIAEWWLPHLTRTVIKQPVMTTVYGVTPIGARRQVYGKIDNMGLKDLDRYRAAHYLSRTVLKAIGDIFHSAGSIMDWIKSHARLIAKSGALVAWTSPLGLPVVQPYRKPGPSARVTTVLGCLSVTTSSQKSRPKVSKQVNGAAPNFIHSIDASHMLMTARACAAKRIAFAAVHDSYWTHAADIDRMAAIARRQFILLHEADPLAALREEWQKKHPQITFSPLPEPGSLDLKKVADSPYFFN